MNAFVALTDRGWFDFLVAREDVDEVNFWQPHPWGGRFGVLSRGEPLLFKLRAPRNAIVGGGFFEHYTTLPFSLAWRAFGPKNGLATQQSFRDRIARLRREEIAPYEDPDIGCILLVEPFFWPEELWMVVTSFDSPYDDRAELGDDRFVYRYQGDDPNHWDNVAVRLAMETRRPILYLVAIRPGLYQAIFPTYVVGDIPERLAFLLMADEQGAISAGSLEGGSEPPIKAYVTREVKQRLHQGRFRYLVLGAYRKRCAMCSLRHENLLDAAHILPDRDDRGLPEVPNGLSLCRIHHGAYDVNIVGIDPDYRLHVRGDVLDEIDGPMLRHGLQELHNGKLIVPRREGDQPNREYLAERFDAFRAA